MDDLPTESYFTDVRFLARTLAELVTPPTVRHHSEPSATTIADLQLADLWLSHRALAYPVD